MPAQGGNRNLDSYVGVHTRVEKFRAAHPTARLITTVIKDEPLTVRCEVYLDGNESGIPNSSGMADEQGGMGGRGNSTLEKVETAAVGRCLAFLGYEVKEGIASREEMQKVQRQPPQQSSPPKNIQTAPDGPQDVRAASPDTDLDRQIREALGALGKNDAWLNSKSKTYLKPGQTWQDLPRDKKDKVFLYVSSKVNEAVAALK